MEIELKKSVRTRHAFQWILMNVFKPRRAPNRILNCSFIWEDLEQYGDDCFLNNLAFKIHEMNEFMKKTGFDGQFDDKKNNEIINY